MSSDETPNVPTPRNTREAVREKAQQVHAQQSRARVMRVVIIAVVAIVVIGGIGATVWNTVSSTVSQPTLEPTGMTEDGVEVDEISAEMLGQVPSTAAPEEPAPEGAPEPTADENAEDVVDIHIYVDYLSPGAGEFERANALQLSGWIDEGAVTVTYHPVALLTANSNGSKYSLRAAAAAACVATHSPEQFYDFNHELLLDQPEIDTSGRTDAELATLAGAVGVESAKAVTDCIENRDFVTWAKDATSRALEGPLPGSKDLALTGTPMVVVGGEEYVGVLTDPAEFSQFVLTVASDSYYATPTPEPTETPSETPTTAPAETPAS